MLQSDKVDPSCGDSPVPPVPSLLPCGSVGKYTCQAYSMGAEGKFIFTTCQLDKKYDMFIYIYVLC